MNSDCIFCKIMAGEAPAEVIWQNERFVAFLSIFPNTPGATVVASKQHLTSDIINLPEFEYVGIMKAARHVAQLLTSSFSDVARTGLVAEGFGVDHAHVKLFPMHGTAPVEEWRQHKSDIDTFFDEYKGYLSSHDSHRVEPQELARIADVIRKTIKEEG